MNKKLIIILIILAVVGTITSAVALHFMIHSTPSAIRDQTPMLCWGTVKIDGVNAPIGTLVDIYIGDNKSGATTVTTAGQYGAVVVQGDTSQYGQELIYKVNGIQASKLGPDEGVFGLQNQVVNLAISTSVPEKTWSFWGPSYVPRHLPDAFYGEVILADLEDIPEEVQAIYYFEDNWEHPELGKWLFWAPPYEGIPVPGTTLDRLRGGTFADYSVSVTGECEWVIPLE